MGPEEGHRTSTILGAVQPLHPIPVLSFAHGLFDDAEDLTSCPPCGLGLPMGTHQLRPQLGWQTDDRSTDPCK
jgi:hypothetical protein